MLVFLLSCTQFVSKEQYTQFVYKVNIELIFYELERIFYYE